MDRQKLIDAGIDYDSGVERLMGNTEMYERFLQMFLDDDSFKNLDAAMQSQNYQEAFLQAHTLKGVAGALDQYKLDNGKYPSMQDGGLDALVNQPASAKNWLPGGYVKGGYPKDSWDNDIQYVIPGSEGRPYDLYSFGADGQSGGEENDADIYYKH